MVALPAVLVLKKSTVPTTAAVPLLVMVALPAVLVSKKLMLFCRFVIFAHGQIARREKLNGPRLLFVHSAKAIFMLAKSLRVGVR